MQRLLEQQLQQQPADAFVAPVLELPESVSGPLGLCSAAAPTAESAAFLISHIRAAVESKLLVPSVCETILRAKLWDATAAADAGAAASADNTAADVGCNNIQSRIFRSRGTEDQLCSQRRRVKVPFLRQFLSEACPDCSSNGVANGCFCCCGGSCMSRRGSEEMSGAAVDPTGQRNDPFAAACRRMSWYEALCLVPQQLHSLQLESTSLGAAAAARSETAAAAAGKETAAASETEAAAADSAAAAESLHLLAVVLPPFGGPPLQRDRLERVLIQARMRSAHPLISSLLQEGQSAVPRSLITLTVALPEPTAAAAAIVGLREFLTNRARPLVLALLFPESDFAEASGGPASLASTAAEDTASAAADAIGACYRRCLQLIEAAATAVCCCGETPCPAVLSRPVRSLLQYVLESVECPRCSIQSNVEPRCNSCCVTLEAAVAAAAEHVTDGSLGAEKTAAVAAAPLQGSATASERQDELPQQSSGVLCRRVLSFLCGALVEFLKEWEGTAPTAADSEKSWIPRVCQAKEGISHQSLAATAGEAEPCGGLLEDVHVRQPSVQQECFKFGGLPVACDDTQTGGLLLLRYFCYFAAGFVIRSRNLLFFRLQISYAGRLEFLSVSLLSLCISLIARSVSASLAIFLLPCYVPFAFQFLFAVWGFS